MKHSKSLFITGLAVVLTLSVLGFAVFAEETYEGSDLPVSESYVIRALNALEARLNQKIDTLADSIGVDIPEQTPETADTEAATDTPVTEAPETEPPAETDAVPANDYVVEYLTQGQSIVGNCELILRSGKAVALCPGANGISDLTGGADLPGNTEITANHLLLVPRNDGRGITVTSSDAYIMVRGTYEIVSPNT